MRRFFLLLFVIFAVPASGFAQAEIILPETGYDQIFPERTIPYPVEMPLEYEYAYIYETRNRDGSPGPNYWQQYAEYDIHAELDPETKLLKGRMTTVYHNNSPITMSTLNMELALNVHAQGAIRIREQDLTDGKIIKSVSVDGVEIQEGNLRDASWSVLETQLIIALPENLPTGETVSLDIEWETTVPQRGASGRMGWDTDLFFVGYWYPQFAVFDDVTGWMNDTFKGNAEFYHGFADYQLSVTLPEDWVVMATGEFLNPQETLAQSVYERYIKAMESDKPVQVIRKRDFGARATRSTETGTHTWKFSSDKVRDVAFSATRKSFWDSARTPVGDLTGDGNTDYTRINAFYRESAPLWKEVVDYSQHAITFLSEMKGFPYPWPHMTAVEGANIIGGGMEFPMITVMGDYNRAGAMALYGVTAHELAHMWIPMIVSTNERRYTWIDEGNTVFSTDEARKDYFPQVDKHLNTFISYINFASTGREGEMMRWSDYHYSNQAYIIASYHKPAAVLVALRGVIGEDVFWDAYHTFIREWAWKHPYPWDMWNTFERVSGKDLSWFWRSWYYETWTLNQAIGDVIEEDDFTIITILDEGDIPMPVLLEITLEDGTTIHERISQDIWLTGLREFAVRINHTGITHVQIDPEHHFPDTERRLNTWTQ